MIREIDPLVTTHEVEVLFKYLDTANHGWVSWNVVEDKVLHVDFR
jgi:hypothetical protein